MKRPLATALAAQIVSVTALFPALPAGATTKPAPFVGATISIPALVGAYGAYQVTLLQVYNNLTYRYDKALGLQPSKSHPLVARLRVSDTGATLVHEDPQRDANALLLGHDYPTWPVVVVTDDNSVEWQLMADAYFSPNALMGTKPGQFSAAPGAPGCVPYDCLSPGTCPTPTVPVPRTTWTGGGMAGGNETINTYGDIKLMPGSAAETCVVFSLPVKVDRTTLKVCWTPDAAVPHRQSTYCWLVDNDKPSAV
jgi:hypothetical protein